MDWLSRLQGPKFWSSAFAFLSTDSPQALCKGEYYTLLYHIIISCSLCVLVILTFLFFQWPLFIPPRVCDKSLLYNKGMFIDLYQLSLCFCPISFNLNDLLMHWFLNGLFFFFSILFQPASISNQCLQSHLMIFYSFPSWISGVILTRSLKIYFLSSPQNDESFKRAEGLLFFFISPCANAR